MANLKDIRDRISSVKNTSKITEAMRLVAAAKVRRAQEQVLRSRPFADRLARILENLQSRMRFEDADAPLLEQRDVSSITLLAVTGDRGLCGGYNANIIKRTEIRYAELKAQGYTVNLVLIGRKAITYFQNRAKLYTIRATFTGLEQVPNAKEAMGIASDVLADFLSGSTDRVEISIDDDGPGIPKDARETVFRPFYRIDESRNVETGGVGLGLTIARDVVHGHGGEILLEDSPLGGLRVRIRLPV